MRRFLLLFSLLLLTSRQASAILPYSLPDLPIDGTESPATWTSLSSRNTAVPLPIQSHTKGAPLYSNTSTSTSHRQTGIPQETVTTADTSVTVRSTITILSIDGTALPLDRPVVTYAVRGGPALLILNGSIALESSTFAVPTQATTLTASGVLVTFNGVSTTEMTATTKMEQPPPTTEEAPEPTTAQGQTRASTARPTETSSAGQSGDPFDHSWLPSPVILKVDGVEYYPPTEQEESVEIFLSDGSIAVLSFGSLKLGDKTIDIPDKVSGEPSVVDGIQFAQRSFGSDSGGGGGGGGSGTPGADPFAAVKGIFEALSASAGPLAVALGEVSGKAMRVALSAAGGPLSGTEFRETIELRDLTQDVTKVAEQVSSFQEQLESARFSQGSQSDLFKPLNERVFSAYPRARGSTNLLKSAAKMLQNLPNLPADVQGLVTERFTGIFVRGMASVGFLVEAYNAYAMLHNIDWDNIAPILGPVGGGQPSSSSVTMSPSSYSSTASATTTAVANETPANSGRKGKKKGYLIPIPTGAKSHWIIDAKYGAVSTRAFREFAKWLDGSVGTLSGASDIIPTYMAWPSYFTDLTTVQADAIRTIPWVRSVGPNHDCEATEHDGSGFARRRRQSRSRLAGPKGSHDGALRKRDVEIRFNSASHLNIISGDIQQNYKAHSSLGAGTTIFIVDTGFNTGHYELARGVRNVEAWYVGNNLAFQGKSFDDQSKAPDNTDDYFGKSVINFSFGIERTNPGFADYLQYLESFSRETEALGAVFVMSAGNLAADRDRLGDHVPQLMGTADNHLITVGGVNPDGTLWHDSEPEGQDWWGANEANDGRVGSVTVYAQGSDVVSCNGDSADSVGTSSRIGTSFASPAVAGLVAYFLGHPDWSRGFEYATDSTSVGIRMKTFLREMASFQRRSPSEVLPPNLDPEYPVPEHVKVAYNLIDDTKPDVDEGADDVFGFCNPDPTTTTTASPSPSPTATCNDDKDCGALSCKAGEDKKCAQKAIPIGPVSTNNRQCECVDSKMKSQVPETCKFDGECAALKCNDSADQKKACVVTLVVGPGLPPIRKCKCTDAEKPSTTVPTPTSTTGTTPTAEETIVLPSPIAACNMEHPVRSCQAYTEKICKHTERAICRDYRDEGLLSWKDLLLRRSR
ncbi:tri m 2 allergen [Colletotrichum musicola]|uniref:Tri m 2 allergen n=1 Tax=Colletotrichum musicola TaxID=2175873 RepID=A0A8H6K203_9PEZI|nr:tri m 2 allergen [Colletotrichum musicola]